MSYTLTIGEAKLELPEEPWRNLTVGVEVVEREDAPEFPGDETTGKSNQRSPSYTTWAESMRQLELFDWMFDKDKGILERHPGCVLLRREDQVIVTQARQRWQQRHPGTEPGWCSCPQCDEIGARISGRQETHTDRDGILARVLWMEWWITWALDNCVTPSFENA